MDKRSRKQLAHARRVERSQFINKARKAGLKLTAEDYRLLAKHLAQKYPIPKGEPKPDIYERRATWERKVAAQAVENKQGIEETTAAYNARRGLLRMLGFDSYIAYLKSPLWQRIRDAVLTTKECYLCLRFNPKHRRPAKQVHHQQYDLETLLGQRLEHLVPVCGRCQRELEFHGKERRCRRKTVELCKRFIQKVRRRLRRGVT